MFPISIKIVVEEDAVDFGLRLTVPDKHPPPTHTDSPSLPVLLMTKGPHPIPKWKIERKKEEEAMGVEKTKGTKRRVHGRAIRAPLSTSIHKQSEIPKFALLNVLRG